MSRHDLYNKIKTMSPVFFSHFISLDILRHTKETIPSFNALLVALCFFIVFMFINEFVTHRVLYCMLIESSECQ